MRSALARLILLSFAGFLAAGSSQAAQVSRHYAYYRISAANKEELITALSRKGPYLPQTKQRHPAATQISFKDRLDMRRQGGYCRLAAANISIAAVIYLPQWRQRGRQREKTGDAELSFFWDMLLKDMKQHEAQHIQIAYAYALDMEQELRSLPARRSCVALRRDAQAALLRLKQNNNAAQEQFDRREAKRLAKRFALPPQD